MDLRRELARINVRGFDFYQRKMGEGVAWHEFNALASEYDSTYDYGGRTYMPAILVPVLWVITTEGSEDLREEGRKAVPTLRFAVSVATLRRCGVSNVTDYSRHLNDVVVYESQVWEITDFQLRGRMHDDVIIGVSATKTFTKEEMVFDTVPESTSHDESTRPVGYPNNTVVTFPNHELPADNGEIPLFPLYGQDDFYGGGA